MGLLAATAYDPGSVVSKATSSHIAMTAFDTTNLRLTFNAPANGIVLVRIRTCSTGSSTPPMILLGVLDGATVKGRAAPITGRPTSAASARYVRESLFLVTGLTAGTSYTWDAAYGVEFAVASTNVVYGGPNNTTSNDAHGAIIFEIWETRNLLAGTLYDPSTAVNKSLATVIAMTAFDTTNLRLTFNAPSSGNVIVHMRTVWADATGTSAQVLLGVLDGATVKGRMACGMQVNPGVTVASDYFNLDVSFPVTGLTPGTSYTWDAAYGVETLLAAANIHYGGPNNTTTIDAWGGFAYEIWAA